MIQYLLLMLFKFNNSYLKLFLSVFFAVFEIPRILLILYQKVLIITPAETKKPIMMLIIALPEPGSIYA